jgi:hypothetical protein
VRSQGFDQFVEATRRMADGIESRHENEDCKF